jgi:methyl-accepting chemotaxis protein
MTKDCFINVNEGFVKSSIAYYSDQEITSNIEALKEVSKENKSILGQIKTAFETIHKEAGKLVENFDEVTI